jgi:hypothetical protein
MKTLTIQVPDDLFAEISHAAEFRKVPKSEIVRERLQGKGGSVPLGKPSLWKKMDDLVISDSSLHSEVI